MNFIVSLQETRPWNKFSHLNRCGSQSVAVNLLQMVLNIKAEEDYALVWVSDTSEFPFI